MKVPLGRRDLAALLGIAAAAALAVSLGVDPRLATELGTAMALLLAVAVLMRVPSAPPRRPPPPAQADALATARDAVDVAMVGPFGAEGRFRRIARDAARARLARRGLDLDDPAVAGMPDVVVALLTGRWDQDRGLTPGEVDEVLTAIEGLEP